MGGNKERQSAGPSLWRPASLAKGPQTSECALSFSWLECLLPAGGRQLGLVCGRSLAWGGPARRGQQGAKGRQGQRGRSEREVERKKEKREKREEKREEKLSAAHKAAQNNRNKWFRLCSTSSLQAVRTRPRPRKCMHLWIFGSWETPSRTRTEAVDTVVGRLLLVDTLSDTVHSRCRYPATRAQQTPRLVCGGGGGGATAKGRPQEMKCPRGERANRRQLHLSFGNKVQREPSGMAEGELHARGQGRKQCTQRPKQHQRVLVCGALKSSARRSPTAQRHTRARLLQTAADCCKLLQTP